MQKKLLAVAVAGALFTPLAMAQSSVTISGTFKAGIDNYRIGSPGLARAGLNTSENRITDNSSQIHFNVTEDLGGGLAGIAKLDVRFQVDGGTAANTAHIGATGNTWVGIRSNSLGTFTIGRHDLHYGKQPDEVPVKGALMGSSVSLMDFAAAGATAVANATRTQNVVRWDSPTWGGFNLTAAWSANPAGVESDLANTPAVSSRKGAAYNLNPSYTASNWQLGYSYWNQKADAPALVTTVSDQKAHVVYGFFRFGAFKVGAAWNSSKLIQANGIEASKRTALAFPVAWFAGPHTLAATYTRAQADKAAAFAALDTKATMFAIAYSYDLSKRTAVSLTYAAIRNNAGAAYDFFTNKTAGGFGSTGSAVAAGEDPRLIAATLRHAF
jgi:predicted porin